MKRMTELDITHPAFWLLLAMALGVVRWAEQRQVANLHPAQVQHLRIEAGR